MPAPLSIVDLLDQVHDGVATTDLDGIVDAWNAGAGRIYGYTAAEMIGQSIGILYFPEDLATTAAWVEAELRARGVAEMERRSRRRDGSEIYVDLRVSLRRDHTGTVIGTIACAKDVSERRRARFEEARQGEELRMILDGVPAMIWYKDRDNRILRANAAAAGLVGATPAAMEGRSTYELFPEEAERYHRDDLEVIRSGVARLGIVEQIQVPGGEKRWIRTDKIPYRDERGEIVGVIVFAVDIDPQRRAELALEAARDQLERRVEERTAALAEAIEHLRGEVAQRQEAERRLELALSANELGMWDWDVGANRAVCDARWAQMLGYPLEEAQRVVGMWEELTHPDDRAAVRRAWEAHVQTGTTPYYEVEHRLRARSGEYRWVLTRGQVVERGPNGEARRVIGTNRDVTAVKLIAEQAFRRQAELAHLQRLGTVNCVAAELAHEINQPLGAIANYANGLAERLRQEQIDREALCEAAAHIGGQALRAATVLRRLRMFIRKETPPPRPVDVNRVVESAAGLIEPEARRQGAALRLQLGSGLPPVQADDIQIEQVVVNLLRNGIEAVAASGASGAVIVTTRGGPGEVAVRVHDSGAGVPAAARARLFEPFFTTKPEGLGMGLSISRSIVETHGGRLWLEPDDGTGATFAFSLPPG